MVDGERVAFRDFEKDILSKTQVFYMGSGAKCLVDSTKQSLDSMLEDPETGDIRF